MMKRKTDRKGLSRRSFLKTAGFAALGGGLGASGAESGKASARAIKTTDAPYELRGDIKRFLPRMTVFARKGWDPTCKGYRRGWLEKLEERVASGEAGFTRVDYAALAAGWTFETGMQGLPYSREPLKAGLVSRLMNLPKYEVEDRELMARQLKKVARLYGAALVGIAELNRLWLYELEGEKKQNEIGPEYKYAVVCAMELDRDGIMTSPAASCGAATGNGYSRMAFVAASVAQFIRALGWKAVPAGNGVGLSVPMAIDAGLGEVGRQGLLITPEYGPRVRLCKIFTDLPLAKDKPIRFGVREFCEVCKKCAKECPPGAITEGERTYDGVCASNNPGAFKWYVNVEECYNYWCDNGAECSNCIRSCPFNKADSWIHGMARLPIRARSEGLDRILVAMDDLMGYGARRDPVRDYWETERFMHTGGYSV